MSELYRDFIDSKADQIITDLGGTITPAPANAELYRDFLGRKFDDVINGIDNVKIKTYSYEGTGAMTNNITFPSKPTIILSIQRTIATPTTMYNMFPIAYEISPVIVGVRTTTSTPAPTLFLSSLSYNDNVMTISGTSQGLAFNGANTIYTVYYI